MARIAYISFYGYRQYENQSTTSFAMELKRRHENLKEQEKLVGPYFASPTTYIDLLYQFASNLLEPKLKDFAMKWVKERRDMWDRTDGFCQLVSDVEMEELQLFDSIPHFDFEI